MGRTAETTWSLRSGSLRVAKVLLLTVAFAAAAIGIPLPVRFTAPERKVAEIVQDAN